MNNKTEDLGQEPSVSPPLPVLHGRPGNVPVDEGFCLSYYRLSYRRKFIRTLWCFYFIPLLFLIPVESRGGLIPFVLGVLALQALYNFVRWKASS
jgi:hypothetical protein